MERKAKAPAFRRGPAPGVGEGLELTWPRRAGGGPSVETGDLRFDGRVRARGAPWRLSAWLDPTVRRGILRWAARGSGRLVASEGRQLEVSLDAPSAAPGPRELAVWSAALRHPLRRLLRRALADPDPRVRAVAARRLFERVGTRRAPAVAEVYVALLTAPGLPDWLQLEAFLRLWRTFPGDRRRWAELALAQHRSSLARVATRAVLWSSVPLEVLLDADPARCAVELAGAWRRAGGGERIRLRNRVEQLPDAQWLALRGAAAGRGRASFADLDDVRRGQLSTVDLVGGELALPAPGDD